MTFFGRVVFSLAVVAVLWCPSVRADHSLVVVTDYWPPFRIADEAGVSGIDMDILQAMAERMGVSLDVRVMPWSRCLEMLRTGKADLMPGLAFTEERSTYIKYLTTPYHYCSPVFYRSNDPGAPEVESYADLRELRVGYTRDSAYFEPFDSDENLEKVSVSQEGVLIAMLDEGRLDVIVGTDCQADYELAVLGLTERIVKTRYRPEHRVALHMGMAAASLKAGLYGKLNRILRELVEDGTVAAIVSSYTGSGEPAVSPPR